MPLLVETGTPPKTTKPAERIPQTSSESPKSKKKSIPEPTAFDIFLKTIKRATNLVGIHDVTQECEAFHYDAFRAAVVLSISALDAYVRTLVVDRVLQQLSEKNTSLNKELADYIKGLLNQDALLEAARKYEFREKVEKVIRADFETKSFQGEYRINFYMNLAGYEDIFEEVAHSANRNKNRLRADLEKYTKRRHVIAHCGDFDLNQIPHSENTIEREFAEKCIEVVSLFAKHIHKVVTRKK